MRSFIDIKQLDASRILSLLAFAQDWLTQPQRDVQKYAGKYATANLFFEPSTRTLLSFELAAKRLGLHTLTPNLAFSSLNKGETVLDTVHTLAAMGVDICIIRHGENGIMQWLVERVQNQCRIINAGEGTLQHPTQTLLDLLTIQAHHGRWDTLSIALLGDVHHSRVARSLIEGLLIMGVRDIRLIAPPALQLSDFDKVKKFTSVDEGIEDVDVVVCLRIQKERFDSYVLSQDFHQMYGLTPDRLKKAKKNAIVMHPGPVNRDFEIASVIVDGPQSVILQQVRHGVAIRIAILEALLSTL